MRRRLGFRREAEIGRLVPGYAKNAAVGNGRLDKGGENARKPNLYDQNGTPYIAVVQAWIGPFGAPCNAPPWGRRTVVDLKTRKLVWDKVPDTARDTGLFGSHPGVPIKTGVPNLGSSMIARGGLVFIGATTDQHLRAFDLGPGEVL